MKQLTQPIAEPISLQEARVHLRQMADGDSPQEEIPDDSWVVDKITAAREYCEAFLGYPLTDASYLVRADCFGTALRLPNGVESVADVQYLDESGSLTSLDPSIYFFDDIAPQILLMPGASWPAVSALPGSVRVTVGGQYGMNDESPPVNRSVPQMVRHAMLLLIGHWYENREGVTLPLSGKLEGFELPLGVEALLRPHRTRLGMA